MSTRAQVSRLVPLLLALVVQGCCRHPAAPEEGEVLLRVESAAIALDRGGGAYVVPWVVENRGSATASVPRCGSAALFAVERWENGAWVSARAAVCITSLEMAPLPVAPGDALRGEEKITGAGRYRLRVVVETEGGREAPRLVTSQAFTLP